MSETPGTLQTWGLVLIKNKLVDAQKWEEILGEHRQRGGKVDIGQILVEKKLLSAKGVEVVGKKVAEVVAKKAAGAPGPAASMAAPPTVAPAAIKASVPATATAAVATATAPPKPAAETGEIQLDDETESGSKVWRPSDAEWVENTETGGNGSAKTTATPPDDIEEIDLVGDDELSSSSGASKIVVDNRPHIKTGFAKPGPTAPGTTGTPGASTQVPKPPTTPSAETVVGATGTEERVPCDVAPNDLDPDAFAYLKHACQAGASDLHLASGSAPFIRLFGTLTFIDGAPKLTPERALRMVLGFMDDGQQQRYLKHHDLDFSYEHPDLGRFRVNALEQFRGPDIIFRIIPTKVPTLEELGLPAALAKFTEWHQGLVLVTGPAGCGKSTTAAALIDLVNSHRKDHVITVEDPVEFLHHSKGCNVTQRQVPTHTLGFANALKAALREDPDVIMIGEMRDLETVALAIRAAETGHLVIGTLQTKSAARTIDRVIDVFPADQQAQIRTMLSESLRGIISQQLVTRADGKGRIVALEVLHVTTAVANLIRDAKTFQLPSQMQTGRKIGQRLMDDSLEELVQAGTITKDEAIKAADNPKRFRKEEPMAVDPKAKK